MHLAQAQCMLCVQTCYFGLAVLCCAGWVCTGHGLCVCHPADVHERGGSILDTGGAVERCGVTVLAHQHDACATALAYISNAFQTAWLCTCRI